jgi:hypothetical protein
MSLKIGLKARRFSSFLVFGEEIFSEKWGVVSESGLAPYEQASHDIGRQN